jgi:hypothetical protein
MVTAQALNIFVHITKYQAVVLAWEFPPDFVSIAEKFKFYIHIIRISDFISIFHNYILPGFQSAG